MRNADRLAYQRELTAAAKRLGLPAHGDIERSLINHALQTVRTWIATHGQPANLSDLLEKIAVSFASLLEGEDQWHIARVTHACRKDTTTHRTKLITSGWREWSMDWIE